jgi:hypothetical protein
MTVAAFVMIVVAWAGSTYAWWRSQQHVAELQEIIRRERGIRADRQIRNKAVEAAVQGRIIPGRRHRR